MCSVNILVRVFLALLLPAVAASVKASKPFETEIRAFEASDRTNPPPAGAVLFLGSSSIRLWTSLASDFTEFQVINRGFGGSQISDSISYADSIVFPYKPRAIVFYAGANDINAGKSPETVLGDFKVFAHTVHRKLPDTRLFFISIAANPARWSQVNRVREANRLVEEFTRHDSRLEFIDVFSQMIGEDGKPRPEIFSADQLHMNAQGYALWKRVVGEKLSGITEVHR
jgi:hypothetical protein